MFFLIKRIIDITFGIIGVVILIPLSVIIKIIFLLTGDFDNIFFVQNRVGKNGKIFRLYKFRTMVVGAEKMLDELLKNHDYNIEYNCSYKIKKDPRLTKVGIILRKTSLDEFPQFINILIGNMSLVGPRPVIEKEIFMFKEYKDIILSVKPGLFGNWVINGRNNLSYDERVACEVFYVKNRSIFLDFKIIFKTIICVIKRTGVFWKNHWYLLLFLFIIVKNI